jgi:hypothetical protein
MRHEVSKFVKNISEFGTHWFRCRSSTEIISLSAARQLVISFTDIFFVTRKTSFLISGPEVMTEV